MGMGLSSRQEIGIVLFLQAVDKITRTIHCRWSKPAQTNPELEFRKSFGNL